MKYRLSLLSMMLFGLAGCAATPPSATTQSSAPVAVPENQISQLVIPPPAETTPSAPIVVAEPAPVPPTVAKPVPLPLQPIYNNQQQGAALLDKLLPAKIPQRNAWHTAVLDAFTHLKIPYTPQYFCAVLAVAEQESGFNPDPVTPNLSKIVWGEIEQRRQKYMIPSVVVNTALMKTSPDGRTFKQRIDALRTKKQMNALYEDMVKALPFGPTIFQDKNPIRDGGPMQVSVAFAETQVRAWPYPYPYRSLRDEVFSLRGSVYFGTAIMLQYPAPYTDMVYRFADYNAGRYSSRNAAFQQAVARLSGRKLDLDGDIMLYSNKMNRVLSGEVSDTQKALLDMSDRLHMSAGEMLRDLKQEKLSGFAQTDLYQRVFTLADKAAGRKLPREIIPQIVLISPKFTHKLTTEWFARRVDGRYHNCLARGGVS